MGRHAKTTRDLGRVTRRGARLLSVALVAGSGVVALAPQGYAGAVNSVTVSVSSSSSTVTSGDLVRYTITATNTGSKPTKPADLVNSVTNGTAQSIRQSSGPDAWTCTQPSFCSIANGTNGMALGATDTFEVVVQAGSPGTMADTATVTVYDYSDGPTKSSGSSTTTVGSGGSGGGSRTITGFCPSTGCTIRSSTGNPTVANTTVSRVTFPACQYATAASQSLCNHGFTFSYQLAPANFCSVDIAGNGACTGSTVNLGDLTVSTLPQFDDANHPINIDLVYDASISTGLSDQNGALFNYKTKQADGNGGGQLLQPCGSLGADPTACNAGQSTVADSNDGDTDLQGSTHLLSSDPWVGSYYVL